MVMKFKGRGREEKKNNWIVLLSQKQRDTIEPNKS